MAFVAFFWRIVRWIRLWGWWVVCMLAVMGRLCVKMLMRRFGFNIVVIILWLCPRTMSMLCMFMRRLWLRCQWWEGRQCLVRRP